MTKTPHCNTVLGRRFCSKCGKWRHLLYFRPRRRNGREYPQSPCDACHNRIEKARRRNARGLARFKRQEYERLHKEGTRRCRGVPARRWRSPVFHPGRLHQYLSAKITYRVEYDGKANGQKVPYLNGLPLAQRDRDLIRHLIQPGYMETVALARVDELATRYFLPLWEIEEAAGRPASYKRKTRAARAAL